MVFLEQKVKLKDPNDLIIYQKRATADPQEMHQATTDAWGEMWNRDPEKEPPGYWDEAIPFTTCLADMPSMQFQEFCVEKWHRCVNKVKAKSARGACGFTKREIQLMPILWIKLLFMQFAAYETHCSWPKLWSIARVACLRKTDHPDPLNIRPITILSRMYRLWSMYRSAEVLDHLSQQLPPQLLGCTGVVSANMLAAYTAAMCEFETDRNNTCAGFVADLIKCYNNIPRVPMAMVLRLLGIPKTYVKALMSLYKGLQRTFDLAGSCSPTMRSTTGIPEGCSMAVACMSALSLLAAKNAQQLERMLISVFYADNWSFISNKVEDIRQAVAYLKKFVTAWKMKISPSKSWTWANKAKARQQLKQIAIGNETIQVKTTAVDLGCDVTYTGNKAKKEANKRCQEAKRRMTRIGLKKWPKKFKKTVTKQAGHAVALYGC